MRLTALLFNPPRHAPHLQQSNKPAPRRKQIWKQFNPRITMTAAVGAAGAAGAVAIAAPFTISWATYQAQFHLLLLRAPSPATDHLASNACIGTGNGSPPWDIELAAIPDPPLDHSSATQPPSNGCDAWGTNCSAPAYKRGNEQSWDNASPPLSAPLLDLLLEDTYFEETGGQELNRPTPTSHTLAHGDGGCAGMRTCPNSETNLLRRQNLSWCQFARLFKWVPFLLKKMTPTMNCWEEFEGINLGWLH